jgi:iron complex transport system substrate-binding protein
MPVAQLDGMARDIEEIVTIIIDAAVKLHIETGPGLLEKVYRPLLARALERRGLLVEEHVFVPFEVDGLQFDEGLRVDLLVEKQVVVELKSAEQLAPVHFKQLLTYLRMLDLRLGLLLNFGRATMKSGIHRVVNRYERTANSPLFINRTAAQLEKEEVPPE